MKEMNNKQMLNIPSEAQRGLHKLSKDIRSLANKKTIQSTQVKRTTRFGFTDVVTICLSVAAVVITIKAVLWIWSL